MTTAARSEMQKGEAQEHP